VTESASLDAVRVSLEASLRTQPDAARRIAQRELPVCAWLLERHRLRDARVVAVNAPQGAGKSTLSAAAVDALGAAGVRAVTVSVDDFYLPYAAQRALAAAHPGNPFLEHRGYPGTHDVPLGAAVLDALLADRGDGVDVPVYDKGAHHGRGDRAPRSAWRRVYGPFDLVLFEGWMVAFAPVTVDKLAHPDLAPCNTLLASYAPWTARCDALLHLAMAEPSYVLDWRVDAERARRAAGAPGLSDDEARDYVRRFVPAYATWSPRVHDPTLRRVLGPDRLPLPEPG
jgi:D-glycerate 3-kinase